MVAVVINVFIKCPDADTQHPGDFIGGVELFGHLHLSST